MYFIGIVIKLYFDLGRIDTSLISDFLIHLGLLLKEVSGGCFHIAETVRFNPKHFMGLVAIINKMTSSITFSK